MNSVIRLRTLVRTFFAIGYPVILLITAFPISVFAASSINYGGGSPSGDVEDVISLPGITVSSIDPSIPLTVSIDDGILSMTTTTGITFSGPSSGSSISFSGSVSDVNAALATLRYRSINPGTKTLTATLANPGEVFNPANGHIYEAVDNGSAMSWVDAKIAAEARTKNGATGYLATITTQQENDYLLGKLLGDGWFGASDATTENDWQWVSGPEAGTSFWAGLGDGSPVGGLFSNWAGGEPNNAGDEDCAQFYSSGSGWNDLPCNSPSLNYYIVEYGAPGDMPSAPDSISFSVEVDAPITTAVSVSSCLDVLNLSSNPSEDRYKNIVMTADIDCTGETITPLFGDVDPDFGNIGYRGVFDGQGHTLSGVMMFYPGDSYLGLFGYTRNAEIKNVTVNGSITGSSCIGGIVGRATDTNLNNVTSSIHVVSSSEQAGGLIGCYYGESQERTMTGNTVSGDVSVVTENAGGLIGYVELKSTSTLDVAENIYSGILDANSWAVGGLISEVYLYDDSELNITNNTIGEINVPSASTVGGAIGYSYTEENAAVLLDDNTVAGNIVGESNIGGLLGEVYNDTTGDVDTNFTVSNTIIDVNVSSTDGDNVGGIAGYASDIYITRSISTGDVYTADDEAGGLIGESYSSSIDESYTTGSVEADDSFAGGLTGRNSDTTISRSYSLANVTGDDRVGGLVGANGGYIYNSYARGSVTGNSEVGGLAGRCGREIFDSYSTGLVTGSSNVGGFLGYSDGCDVTDSFWDIDTSTQATSDGDESGLGSDEMKKLETYTVPSEVLSATWDVTNVWGLKASYNDGYPCLRWEDGCGQLDDDDDGVSSVVEEQAPNNGDGNNDGIQDKTQVYVSSLVNPVTNQYATLAVDSSCEIDAISAAAENANEVSDAGFTYPAGLMDFTLDCSTLGHSATITQFYFGITKSNLILRKYNSVNKSYATVPGAVLSDVTIGGRQAVKVVYVVVDGGPLDEDGTVNGAILDPAGVALSVVGVPATGLGGTAR